MINVHEEDQAARVNAELKKMTKQLKRPVPNVIKDTSEVDIEGGSEIADRNAYSEDKKRQRSSEGEVEIKIENNDNLRVEPNTSSNESNSSIKLDDVPKGEKVDTCGKRSRDDENLRGAIPQGEISGEWQKAKVGPSVLNLYNKSADSRYLNMNIGHMRRDA